MGVHGQKIEPLTFLQNSILYEQMKLVMSLIIHNASNGRVSCHLEKIRGGEGGTKRKFTLGSILQQDHQRGHESVPHHPSFAMAWRQWNEKEIQG